MRWYVKKVSFIHRPSVFEVAEIVQGDEFDSVKTVDFPFYRTVGLHSNLKFEIELWAYAECKDGEEGPPFKDTDNASVNTYENGS
jgi:hypothetical protein